MKPKFIHLYYPIKSLILMGLILLAGCGENMPEPVTTNSAIQGYARDGHGGDVGAEVTAIGPYGRKTVTTNANGYFFIDELGNGTYDLEYTKEGYGTYKKFGFQLFGGDTLNAGYVDIYPRYETRTIPLLTDFTDHRELTGFSADALVIRTNRKENLPPIRFFIGFDNKVNFENYEYTMGASQLNRMGEPNRLYVLHYFYQLPLESGQAVYLTAYICTGGDNGYLDLHKNKRVFPTLVQDSKTSVFKYEIP
jgi:hypothetical protein